MRTLPLTLLLCACGRMGLESYNTDKASPGEEEAEGPIGVTEVDPAWAPLEGGTEVVVSGWGFSGEVRFWFGGSEVDVTVLSDETLVVFTPEVRTEASVDLIVSADSGEVTLPDAFTFSASAPADDGGGDAGDGGDSSDGGGDDGSSAEGLVSGLVQLDYLAIGCPDCFGASSAYQITGSAAFHEPVATSWFDWLPATGGCVVNPTRAPATSSTVDVGGHVYLEQGAVSIDLRRSGSGSSTTYASAALASEDYTRSAAYDLLLPGGGDWESLTVSDALSTTSGFTSLEPIELLYDGASAFPRWSASSMSMSWAPSGVAEAMILDIIVYNPAGSTQVGEVMCVAADSGGLTVPASAWSGFPSGALLAVYFYRWQTSAQVNPRDGSTIEGVATFGMLGTAELLR